jgi:hypothetical protein
VALVETIGEALCANTAADNRRGIGRCPKRIRGRDLLRSRAVVGLEKLEGVGARSETTTHCGCLDFARIILSGVANEVYGVIRYDKHKATSGSLDPNGASVSYPLG